jgi:hypothetical protein
MPAHHCMCGTARARCVTSNASLPYFIQQNLQELCRLSNFFGAGGMALHGDSFASAHEFEYVPQKKKPIQASPMPRPTRWPTSVSLKPCAGSKGVELSTERGLAKRPGTDMAFFNIY